MIKKIFFRVVSASTVGILILSLIGLLSCDESGGTSPPPSPNSLTAVYSSKQVELNWTASEGADSYTIYWAETAAVDIEAAKAAGRFQEVPSGTSATIGTLTAGKTYYFAATASSVNGESAKSQEVSIALPLPPPSPNSLTAVYSNKQVELNWTASEGADSYTVYWAETAAVDIEAAKAAGRSQEVPSGTSVTISTLTAGKTYYFAATASNVNGESTKSQEVSISLPSITVTASEIADRWGLFQVSGDAEENAAEDYYFGVKAADAPAPTDSQAMQNDLNVKVYAVSSVPINIILSTVMDSPLIPFFNGATDAASAKAVWTDADLGFLNANVMPGDNQYAARDSLLSPSTAYKIYGYKQGESRVYELAKFTTIAVKTSFGGTGVWPTDSKRINDTITFHEGNYEILSLQRQGGSSDKT